MFLYVTNSGTTNTLAMLMLEAVNGRYTIKIQNAQS